MSYSVHEHRAKQSPYPTTYKRGQVDTIKQTWESTKKQIIETFFKTHFECFKDRCENSVTLLVAITHISVKRYGNKTSRIFAFFFFFKVCLISPPLLMLFPPQTGLVFLIK